MSQKLHSSVETTLKCAMQGVIVYARLHSVPTTWLHAQHAKGSDHWACNSHMNGKSFHSELLAYFHFPMKVSTCWTWTHFASHGRVEKLFLTQMMWRMWRNTIKKRFRLKSRKPADDKREHVQTHLKPLLDIKRCRVRVVWRVLLRAFYHSWFKRFRRKLTLVAVVVIVVRLLNHVWWGWGLWQFDLMISGRCLMSAQTFVVVLGFNNCVIISI